MQSKSSALFCAGVDLSSQVVTNQVFSTQMSLTSVFGMGTGGTSLLSTPAALKNRIEILTDEVFRELKDQLQKEKQSTD